MGLKLKKSHYSTQYTIRCIKKLFLEKNNFSGVFVFKKKEKTGKVETPLSLKPSHNNYFIISCPLSEDMILKHNNKGNYSKF